MKDKCKLFINDISLFPMKAYYFVGFEITNVSTLYLKNKLLTIKNLF